MIIFIPNSIVQYSNYLDEDYEEMFNKPKPVTWFDYVKHTITIFWRLTFALIPPPGSIHSNKQLL